MSADRSKLARWLPTLLGIGVALSVAALYELAYSYMEKRDFDQSLATARTGAEYKSDLLPLFYDLMASSLDSKGQPEQAVEMYKKGLTVAPNASQLYFNMAVTYRESLNKPDEARRALEKAAALDPMHPGVHILLGQVFQASGYPTPAFLALSTFLVLDPAGSQGRCDRLHGGLLFGGSHYFQQGGLIGLRRQQTVIRQQHGLTVVDHDLHRQPTAGQSLPRLSLEAP